MMTALRLLKLTLENFQSHAHTEIDLSQPITTIRGESDIGKSAILRALGWVVFNNFSGDSFIRHGEKRVTVKLEIMTPGGPFTITRTKTRGGAENSYFLNDEEFKAFGQGVPFAIANLLNVASSNFQFQHDSPYWFTLTAGEVSRQLNKIIDLSLIDKVMSTITSKVRDKSSTITSLKEMISTTESESEDDEQHLKRIREFERLAKLKEELDARTKNYLQLDVRIIRVHSHTESLTSRKEKLRDGEALEARYKEALRLHKKINSLEGLIESIGDKSDACKIDVEPIRKDVTAAFDSINQLERQAASLERLIGKITRQEKHLENLTAKIIEGKKDLKQAVSRFPTCNTCLQPLFNHGEKNCDTVQ